MQIVLRVATPEDAVAIAELYLAARKRLEPTIPLVHDDEDVRRWISHRLLPESDVEVAELGKRLVGMMALSRADGVGWIDQLYLDPAMTGRGIGSRFVASAKARYGPPLRLYTFRVNVGACRFYERHGFIVIRTGDGSDNEEGLPDVLYEWAGE
ncbi:MAG: GNAT family N-acetyltransferase [Ardenticatenales bacterium]|nr:GNAT family N-acetyltransferase [Ardenticatenales bacterium]MCB9172562.1 GNAT family N-acetyltransferase [Ardenticatenales bacterium]